MYGDPEFFFLKPLSWLDADRWEDKMLGAFVKEFPIPTNGSVPDGRPESKSLLQYNKFPTEDGRFTEFILDAHAISKKGADATLKGLAQISFTGEKEHAHLLEGKYLRFKRLAELDQFFDAAKKDDNVKARVPNWIKHGLRNPVCLVVGIMICEDVELLWDEKAQRDVELAGEIPVATIARAAAGIPAADPTDDTGNPGLAITSNQSEGKAFRAKTGDKKIFALQLRTVTKGRVLKTIRRNRLRMGDGGPSVDQGRKFGVGEEIPDRDIDDDELFLEQDEEEGADEDN